jgi:prepilin-type processing-associated H-X9-DG protein
MDWYNEAGSTGEGVRSMRGWTRNWNMPREDRPLNQYLGEDGGIAHCPLDVGDSIDGNDKPTWQNTGNSYWYFRRSDGHIDSGNRNGLDRVWAIGGHRLAEIEAPTKKKIIGEPIDLAGRSVADPRNWWHNQFGSSGIRASMVFVDGHAENLERKTNFSTGFRSGISDAEIHDWSEEAYY